MEIVVDESACDVHGLCVQYPLFKAYNLNIPDLIIRIIRNELTLLMFFFKMLKSVKFSFFRFIIANIV